MKDLYTAFPPVMLRREVAKSARFDPALKRSEDFDYLMKVLAGKSYRVLAEVVRNVLILEE